MSTQRAIISILSVVISIWLYGQKVNLSLYYDKEKTIPKETYEVIDSALNGQYVQYYRDGQIKVKGYYQNNVPAGIWEYFYGNGHTKMRGELRKNKNFGMWEYYYENGSKSMEGSIFGGKRQGNWNFYYSEGLRKSHGEFVDSEKVGKWLTYYPSGELKAEAEYEKNRGKYIEFYKTGEQKVEGLINNGNNHGMWIFYYLDGQVQANGAYANGLKNGFWRYFYENGQVSTEGNYIDDKQEGEWVYYHHNGIVSSKGALKDGKKDGYWSLFDDSGILAGEGEFLKGGGIYTEYHGNGKIKATGKLFDGKKYGKWSYYYNSGELEGESIFEDDKGNYVGYFKAGSKKMSGKIENDQKVGTWELFNRDGSLAGYYKPIDDEEHPEFELREKLIREQKPGEMKVRRIPDYLYKKKKFQPFIPRLNEFKGLIIAYNPFSTFLGNFPISVEWYAQERIGHEIQFSIIRDPFFSKDENIALDKNFERGFAVSVKQKFYMRNIGSGAVYFAHELRYTNLDHSANVFDPNLFSQIVINADETRYEYSLIVGRRYFKQFINNGFTLDVFVGAGTGFRDFDPHFSPRYESVFDEVRTSKIPFAFRLGVNIGYLFRLTRR